VSLLDLRKRCVFAKVSRRWLSGEYDRILSSLRKRLQAISVSRGYRRAAARLPIISRSSEKKNVVHQSWSMHPSFYAVFVRETQIVPH
jgi:hypothetical protein